MDILKKLAEVKDPAALIVSGLALFVSLVAAYLTWRQKRSEMKRMLRIQIGDAIGKLIESEIEADRLGYQISNQEIAADLRDSLRSQRSKYNRQRFAMARVVWDLVNQGRSANRNQKVVSSVEWESLARAFGAAHDTDKADTCWRIALNVSPDGIPMAQTRRAYAIFLFAIGRQKDARDQYDAAIQLTNGDTDQGKWESMWTYLEWALSEAQHGSAQKAREYLSKATTTCDALTSNKMKDEGKNTVLSPRGAQITRLIPATASAASAASVLRIPQP